MMVVATLARADVAALAPTYKSAAEEWWANMGPIIIGDELGSPVVDARYEPLALRIPGGSYKFDFYYLLADGREVALEVKGSKRQKNYRDARSHLRAAAEWWPQWTWYEVRIARPGVFELERIDGRA